MNATRKHTRKRRRLRIDLARHGMACKLIKARISDTTAARLDAACKSSRLPAEDIVRAGLNSILKSIEEAGEPAISTANAPVLMLSPTTRRRMAELDYILGIVDGEGVAERVLYHVAQDLMDGDYGLVFNGWEFNDPAETEANLRCVCDRWASDDTLSAIRNRKAVPQ